MVKTQTLQLQTMCNKYGDFMVARAWRDHATGEMRWTKWRSVLECWHSDEGIRFLETANNRTVLPCEIVIDIDDPPQDQKSQIITTWLNKIGQTYTIYHTGSKGYHIHMIIPELLNYTRTQREVYRKTFFNDIPVDTHKTSERSMIALEGAPHWKTGNKKTEVSYHELTRRTTRTI